MKGAWFQIGDRVKIKVALSVPPWEVIRYGEVVGYDPGEAFPYSVKLDGLDKTFTYSAVQMEHE